jgi:hypothetical protein
MLRAPAQRQHVAVYGAAPDLTWLWQF